MNKEVKIVNVPFTKKLSAYDDVVAYDALKPYDALKA